MHIHALFCFQSLITLFAMVFLLFFMHIHSLFVSKCLPHSQHQISENFSVFPSSLQQKLYHIRSIIFQFIFMHLHFKVSPFPSFKTTFKPTSKTPYFTSNLILFQNNSFLSHFIKLNIFQNNTKLPPQVTLLPALFFQNQFCFINRLTRE